MEPLYEFALSVKAIQRELERRTNEAMAPLGLTGAQADALIVIGQAEPLALKDLGGLLIAEGGHPSRLVDRLVAAKLVKRQIPRNDRRSVVLTLTAAGHRLLAEVETVRAGIFDLARALIGERDLDPALELLRELAQYTAYGELIARRQGLLEGGDEGG
jgi:DNA-binding MarR family transcriptional regulator